MRFSLSLLALPASLLQLLTNGEPTQAPSDDLSPVQWPYNLPRDAKVWPEDPPNRRRDVEAIKHLVREGAQPVAVKKMSGDPSEKFFPEYWGFSDHEMEQAILGIGNSWALRQEYHAEEDNEVYTNGSMPLSFRPPFPMHTDKEDSLSRRDIMDTAREWLAKRDSRSILAILKKRGFECIAGTAPCKLINPDLCCGQDETCYTIPDTGLGTVGCCPAGQTCGGNISCASGNTPCFVNNTGGYTGGGCCIPGYVCSGVGCVPSGSVVTSTPGTTSTQTTIISASSSVVVVTETVRPTNTPSTSTFTTTDTAIQTTSVCPASYTACPVNLGGGCCPSGQSCRVGSCPTVTTQTSTLISTSTTTGGGVIPTRVTFSSQTTSSAITNSICPTGFYACSATYRGGCCQTGQDCKTTNCPEQASTTIVSSGQTIVVPLTPSATTTAVGHCAGGWSPCATSLGGDCCPDNWACGTVSCFSSIGPSQSASRPKDGLVLGGAGRVVGGASLLAVMAGLVFALVIL